jgi:hypothetical protein
MMGSYKVVMCDNPLHARDDWDTCPFAHPGETVTRRPPATHLPKLCPKARRACRKGLACPYAHNVFEREYGPRPCVLWLFITTQALRQNAHVCKKKFRAIKKVKTKHFGPYQLHLPKTHK